MSVFSVCQTNASAVELTFDPPLIIVASKPPALFAVPKESEHGVEDVEEYDDCLYTPEEYDTTFKIRNTDCDPDRVRVCNEVLREFFLINK